MSIAEKIAESLDEAFKPMAYDDSSWNEGVAEMIIAKHTGPLEAKIAELEEQVEYDKGKIETCVTLSDEKIADLEQKGRDDTDSMVKMALKFHDLEVEIATLRDGHASVLMYASIMGIRGWDAKGERLKELGEAFSKLIESSQEALEATEGADG